MIDPFLILFGFYLFLKIGFIIGAFVEYKYGLFEETEEKNESW